jgi:hypothetical protein
LILALVLALATAPEAARAEHGPVLFGGGESAYLLVPAAAPGEPLTVATLRLKHPELSPGHTFDDASYRFPLSPADLSAVRSGRVDHLTGTIWRFGVDRPEGRKEFEGVRADVRRVDTIPLRTERGLGYRAFGTPDRLYLIHPGRHFSQILKAVAASELELAPEGSAVVLDRPEAAATRLLPGETARVRMGPGQVVRLTGLAELWFVDAPSSAR